MNKIILKGRIKDIQYSHTIKDVDFYKAHLIVKNDTLQLEDLINLKFKRFSNIYNELDEVNLEGNIRTYSSNLGDKNKVEVYVFTYFDKSEEDKVNYVELDGKICKTNTLRKTKSGKDVYNFILANNLINDNQILNSYIPCVAWGKLAKELSKLDIGTGIKLIGSLHSREYKKELNNKDFEFRIAHEVLINNFEVIED